MIKFERVGVTFSGDYQALNDVSFHISRGEFTYILGRSGAGKSTLLKLIYADLVPTRGIVRIAGDDISYLPRNRVPYLRRQVGVVLQDFMLLSDKTVFDNVRMALDVYYMKRSDVKERIWRLLKRLGIFELRDSRVESLSGGEKQRVAIARAMVNDPQIIVADEPTGNLDKDNAMIIMQMLIQAQQLGTTILMATHDMGIVDMYPARDIILEGGRIISDTKPLERQVTYE